MLDRMSARIINGPDELKSLVGEHLGYSPYTEITQDQVNLFADATGDHQWIHVDPERAKTGPFGTTIAHGYLTMSLTNHFLPELIVVRGISMGLNYGLDKVRFPAPVRVGSRIRARGEIVSVEDVPGGVQAKVRVTLEIENEPKPACVIETLSRFLR
jgi:acyl dehydratase